MGRAPIQFVCQKCGADLSPAVNTLIGQELGVSAAPATPSLPEEAKPAAAPPPSVRVQVKAQPAAEQQDTAPEALPLCPKHFGQQTTHQCLVCQRPMCPKCMEIFGFVCSPLCKARAEAQGLEIPVYEQQRAVVQKGYWRHVGRVAIASTSLVVLVLGVWGWYEWFGSRPKVARAVPFSERAVSGQCRFVAPHHAVWLHGGRLTCYDLKAGREVWSHELLDKAKFTTEASEGYARWISARTNARSHGGEVGTWQPPSKQEWAADLEASAASALGLQVESNRIWVRFPNKLVRYDVTAGQPAQEIGSDKSGARWVGNQNDYFLMADKGDGRTTVTHVNLLSDETGTEEIAGAGPGTELAAATPSPAAGVAKAGGGNSKPLNPATVAAQAQNLSMPGRLALPAMVAANANQERLVREMNETPEATAPTPRRVEESGHTVLVPDGASLVQFSVTLLESKIVEHTAMKAPPKKSALEGTVNQAATTAIANEILNEMQRDRGGDVVREDESRYQVKLRRLSGAKDPIWTGEVIGPPGFHPLRTIDLVTGNKTLLALDKTGKPLWEAKLNYNVVGTSEEDAVMSDSPYGQGPYVERGDKLYVYDQGLLTAFEVATGNVPWRLPSVGVAGLFFDDKGMIYVNTTTASQDRVRYSRQIDISEKTRQLILKVDPANGKILWRADQAGLVQYVSGKFVYTVQSYAGDDEIAKLLGVRAGTMPAHVLIRRLNPAGGEVWWEHYQRRVPLDVQFQRNTIQVLFRKEWQELKFISF